MFKSILDNTWRLNYNYWTSSLKFNNSVDDTFRWCEKDNPEVSSTVVQWQKGQPDNLGGNQRCLHMRILTNVSQVVVSDRNCSDKYVLACEVFIS